MKPEKTNSIKTDVLIAVGALVGFYLLLLLATFLDRVLGLSEAYTLVDIARVVLSVAVASVVTWALFRFAFPKTIGKDFGLAFNDGWNAMTKIEQSRWIIGAFVTIISAILISS